MACFKVLYISGSIGLGHVIKDLAIVQGGFSSTLELTALKRPFIYFPIEGHSEQNYVSKHLDRHKAGVKMLFSNTTPASLADAMSQNINKQVSSKTLNINGANDAAKIINRMLSYDR